MTVTNNIYANNNNAFINDLMERWNRSPESFAGKQAFILEKPLPKIRQIIYSDPATIIIWQDKTKTVVKCTENDEYNPTTGLALCVMKKVYGTTEYRKILKEHLPKEEASETNG